jgi:ribosomal-protein-alanine N-acetyltransferase
MMSFDPFPTLETPRLVLRQIVAEDLPVMFRIQSDREVVRYFGRPADASPEDTQKRLELILTGVRECSSIRWALTPRDSGELVGSGGFWRWDKAHRWAEIGYELLPSHWGKGLMPEALVAMIRFGFERMELHRVEANIDPANVASRRVLEKLRFVCEGVKRENWYYEGQYTDTAHYGLLRRDFERISSLSLQ